MLMPKAAKPARLLPGDTIAIIAPASAPKDPEQLQAGMAHFRDRGYCIEIWRDTFSAVGYLCGTDEQRLDELNHYLQRPDIKMLVCARGGYGTLRLLSGVDYTTARRYPKLIVGYSDITALQLALFHKAGLPSLSGPMAAVEWGNLDAESETLFWEIAGGATPQPLLGPHGETLEPVRSGDAEGLLLGGNLSLITRMIGTPYLPSLDGAILFVEETGEPPYRIDGLFAHLKLSGVLDGLNGLVLGAFTEWEPTTSSPSLSLEQVLDDYTKDLNCPVARGLVYGHFPVKNTMPIGVMAHLNVCSNVASLSILDPISD